MAPVIGWWWSNWVVGSLHRGLSERQLRWWLWLFFLALAAPALLLISRAYDQLQWEVFHQARLSAEELSARIDTDLRHLIDAEEARSFGDYGFLIVLGDTGATFVQRSQLSQFPTRASIPGLVGYFQVDSAGTLTSPVVPAAATDAIKYGVSQAEYRQRVALSERLQRILGATNDDAGERVDTASAPPKARRAVDVLDGLAIGASSTMQDKVQNAYDRLASSFSGALRRKVPSDYGRVEDLKLDSRLEQKSRTQRVAPPAVRERVDTVEKRKSRKEHVSLYNFTEEMSQEFVVEAEIDVADDADMHAAETVAPRAAIRSASVPEPRVRLFESEIDPFSFAILDADYFVLFRNVWRAGERFIQGAVIDRVAFIDQGIASAYRSAGLSGLSDLLVAYEGDVIAAHGGEVSPERRYGSHDLSGALLYRTRLAAPLSGFELIYTVSELPLGPGTRYLGWVTVVLALVLSGGCVVIYRYGVAQISLFRQQQDFVSAVSHELKTPLTSIRMYSEILQAGWADEDKKASYYTFIHDESERLSRLITNVLQLARMTRGKHTVDSQPIQVGALLDTTQAKTKSQVAGAGFELHTDFSHEALLATLLVDADMFAQIMINLIDNAIKFSPTGAARRIDLGCTVRHDGAICFTVRDYGGGVATDQMQRIFELFYRPESELTRVTLGTGIGLALVQQLTVAMGGQVTVKNRDPGAEFSLTFAQHEQ
ncbi:MAG: HAMP domain-containing histidine kinase [Proteobacteria bacterium]|nr:MAG: HAMP domain-containing histidine kinase [Pseudomonadota bacterium]